ncbi:MAG: AarF/ABC1/UbiB kinase family protein [Myxococcales bacterium]|nr:AarF/ABC1/UbiB kinase family protein [Myxococcales bacterium]
MASVLSAVRDIGRLREICVVLVRHGFADLAQRIGFGARSAKKPDSSGIDDSAAVPDAEAKRGEDERRRISLAERVRLVAMDLGPSFVKLGQIASTRPDLLPPEWIVELKKLQDEVSPLSFDEIRATVESSLGAPLAEIYESFDETPLAAASIAQVHRATLKTAHGPQDVVVKAQRPKIAETVLRDVELLQYLARFVERTIPESHIYCPTALVAQFDTAITAELDFTLEADNARRFADNFASHPHALFPKIFKEASSKRVLTMSYLDGAKVYDAIGTRGFAGPAIAKAVTGIIIKMIFEDGFFHADPHPGNILIMGTPEAPRLALVDLGMVGRLSPELRNKTIDMMIAAIRKDYESLADALYAIGTPTKKVDMRAYRAEVAMLADKYLGKPLGDIDLAMMLGDLVKGATKYGLEIPADFLLVGKAIMTIEGIGKEIDPGLDVFEEARPYFTELLRRRYSPERIAADLWRGAERLSVAAYDLPQQMREVMEDLRLGRLTLRTHDVDQRLVFDRLGRRVLAGLVIASSWLAGASLIVREGELRGLGIALMLLGASWLFWHVALDFRRR